MRRLIAGLAACLAIAAPAMGKTPVPTVSGPIPQAEANHAFGGAAYTLKPEDLAKSGFVEEEFFVSGKANVYDWPASGPVVRTPDAPYVTRILVRRPARAARFSGRVIVEMLNPTNLLDLNIGWAIHRDEFLRRGDAWVGITAKPVAVVTLKTFNPQRYQALDWGNPLPVNDPKNCAQRGDGSQNTENGLVWDMNTQIGAWIRSADPKNPFRYGGAASKAKWLYGWGYSQTGGFLYTYINAIHPLVVQADGRPMFDGYLVAVATGPSAINQCAAAIPAGDPRRSFGPVGVPVIQVMSQSDYLNYVPQRRPDGNTPADRFRHYDNAGSGHATPDELYWGPRPADIVKGGRVPPPVDCNEGPRSRFPSRVPFNAELRMLEAWVEKGTAPPPSQNIEVKDRQPVLDAHGNVTGGMRTPYLDAPTSVWYGNSTGPSFCRIGGHELGFTPDKLKALYPTHAAYVAAVTKSVEAGIKARTITPEDGRWMIDEAKATAVPPR
ncbi:MAG TPA: alpha/beta hydrolase domain-containing protein [Caulobacteraceae bacterium]|nr:alpha/beta hydrolase domain-containing protein [Caulobacteraceae bacterium]